MDDISKNRPLSRNGIKYMAIFAMLLNHITHLFPHEQSMLLDLMEHAGYFSAFAMLYFLVEGYYYTRSKSKYALRLLIFAVIAQPWFSIVASKFPEVHFTAFNMLFTLLLCFGIIHVQESFPDPYRRSVYTSLAIIASFFFDWNVLAPIITLVFIKAHEGDISPKRAFGSLTLMFVVFNLLDNPISRSVSSWIYLTALSLIGPVTAGFCIICLYNGKSSNSDHSGGFSKWFFYIFYPLHLFILSMIKLSLCS